jgi:IS30 family transposase
MAHLTLQQRYKIERMLQQGASIRQIAAEIGVDHSTVSREIKKRRLPSNKTYGIYIINECKLRQSCTVANLCFRNTRQGELPSSMCKHKCSACRVISCNSFCEKFIPETCDRLINSPGVCNGCNLERKCSLPKYYYISEEADKQYKATLSDSRKGTHIEDGELAVMDEYIYNGIKKGQSVNHIMNSNLDYFIYSNKTIYTLINSGVLRIKRHDLPQAANRKPRKTRKGPEHKVDTKCRINRSYEDFQNYKINNPGMILVEMDTVLGKPGGKCVLTLQLNVCGMMLVFIRDHNNSQSVIDVFNKLEQDLGTELFTKIFPVILTDNGSEFTNPTALETSIDNVTKRTTIFYCEPYSSWQKGHIENNNGQLRNILEKHTSFDNITQEDCNLIMSHINSYRKASLNNKTAIELFTLIYGEEALEKLNIKLIPGNEVILLPDLLNKF